MKAKKEAVDLRLPTILAEGLQEIADKAGLKIDEVIAVALAQHLVREVNKAPEPFYSMGVNLEKLGAALQDSRSTCDRLASLAHACGLHMEIRITGDEGEKL